ncbi:hypothetical protein ARMSODRAFT_980575 [Armillaria solidipes]|uniref:CCHC-type domain-containing protein n=1 Tax=Armillaria solidipes TaxID=1076256 RepID=A0A2H3BD42_9AGAR|nr:hypothetical protein ARMSODRAFT_980575 [Armillaria solidipes]
MSQEHMADPSVPPSLHSSLPSPQDFPPLPTRPTPPASTQSKKSWISGKKEEGSSSITTRASRSLRELLRGSRKTKSSSQLTPVPSSPPRNTTPRPVLIHTDSSQTGTHQRSLYARIPKPSAPAQKPSEELQQALREILTETARVIPSSREPSPEMPPLTPTTAEQVVHDWRAKQQPSIGEGSEPPVQKPTPSTKSSKRSERDSLSTSSRGGSNSIEGTERTRSLGDTLGSLSIHGWDNTSMRGIAVTTPEARASEYMSIWNTRCTILTTEVSWRLSPLGLEWERADPVEQEDIINYSTTEQAIQIYNTFYPEHALAPSAPYQSRYHQPPLPKSPPHAPPLPFSSPKSHPYKGKGRVNAGGDTNPWGGGDEPSHHANDNESDIEIPEPQPGGSGPPNKGKWVPHTGFFKGTPPPDRYADPVIRHPNRLSLPGAPDKFKPDSQPPNPIGPMSEDAPWIGCKPDLIRKPLPFSGESDDIDRFITDCQMYFQVHSAYMWLDPYRVAFASSYFEDKAKDWWTLLLADLYSTSRGKYRFPPWGDFAKLRMDLDDRGHMVTALRQGVPASYTNMISNIEIGIPIGYEQWKERIVTMNKERQRKQALDLISGMYLPRQQQSKGTPHAGASKESSGTTTAPTTKKTGTGTTYLGRGQPMNIDAIKSGDCFRCSKKGHISRNCPEQTWNKGKQQVRASTTEPSGSKIEEVKDAAGKRSNQPRKESHNRYAVLIDDIDTVSIASTNESEDSTEIHNDASSASSQEHRSQNSTNDQQSP